MMPRIFCHCGGFRRLALSAVLVLGGIIAMLGSSRPAAGQTGLRAVTGGATDHTVPTKTYHLAFVDFYDGDYLSALGRFKTESRMSIKTAQSRWIDSICYETMQGSDAGNGLRWSRKHHRNSPESQYRHLR